MQITIDSGLPILLTFQQSSYGCETRHRVIWLPNPKLLKDESKEQQNNKDET
jgi:hypothetical protein